MNAILVGGLALALLGSISCVDNGPRGGGDTAAGECECGGGGSGGAIDPSTIPATTFSTATSGAFQAFWQGQLQITMQENWQTSSHDHAARSLYLVAGLGKNVAPRYTIEDVPAKAIRSSTPTLATARVIEPGPLPTFYAARDGEVTIASLPSSGHDFGRYRVHIDIVVVDIADSSHVLRLVGEADVPVTGVE